MSNSSVAAAQFHEYTFPDPRYPEYTFSRYNLAESLPLDNGRFPKTPQCDLGVLDALPLELLQSTLAQVDLATLTEIRRVNQRARDVVDSILEYDNIVTYVPNILRVLIVTETASYITCKKLHDKLRDTQCEDCGYFGEYLYLLTCRRVCSECLAKESYYPVWEQSVERIYDNYVGLTPEDVSRIPRMRILPCPYVEYVTSSLAYILDRQSLRNAQIRRGQNTTLNICRGFMTEYAARSSSCVRIPAFDPISKEIEWGSHCLGCYGDVKYYQYHPRPEILFIKADFHRHLNEHGRIVRRNDDNGLPRYFHDRVVATS
ncbi:hypothetical protein SLS58_007487 [Diplodia intermedia]|uniref:F-box domain-containing protein n=1 Tax=Diplodia intermedia TaxID=856260 RepID=A0ABR3TKY7_9PEZI